MLPLSPNSHVPFQRIGRSQSIKSTDDHENRATGSKSSRLLGKLKVGSGSKRKQASVGSPAPSRTSSNDGGASPFRLAQRLRTLLDAHPVNSPAPSFQPLPTPETSPSPPLVPRSFQQSEPFPTSPVAGPSNQTPESSVSSPTTFFSAPSSPADSELAALLSSPILPIGAAPGSFDFPPFDAPATPSAGPSATVYQVHTPTSLSPARHEAVFNFLDRIGSPKARARRLSRATVDGSPSRDRQSLNASPRAWPASPAMSSISSVLASGSVTAAYGSDGMRNIEEETSDDEDDDDTSIMMYSPLMPTPTSLVAIAESEVSIVAVQDESDGDEEVEPVLDTPPPPAPAPQPPEQTRSSGWGLSKLWPFTSWFSSTSPTSSSTPSQSNAASNTEPPAATPRAQQSTALSPRPTSAQVRLRRRRVWVPSRTQLSLETTWWGYRIYIPPPVTEALDSTSIETSRRAALLTAALTWFFTNLPVNVLPITVRPVIVILQGLVPYLGYLGGILSWSWGTIRSYDEGYGIILSATWLMPIALIPSTWVPPPSEWPGSPLSTASAPVSPTTVTQSTPPASTLSPSSFSTLSPTISQSTSPLPSSSPALSQSTVTPTPRSPSSLPISPYLRQQDQSPQPPQGQLYPVYSPALVPLSPRSPAPSLPLTREYTQDQAQQQGQPYPAYSPYSYTTMLSPLSQLSASFPTPVMNPSSYGYTYGQPFPTSSQTPPIMAMSMISPIPANGTAIYSPTMTPSPAPSPYMSPSAAPSPSSAPGSPLPSTPLAGQRRTRNRNGSLYAPRMATVPLPDDDR